MDKLVERGHKRFLAQEEEEAFFNCLGRPTSKKQRLEGVEDRPIQLIRWPENHPKSKLIGPRPRPTSKPRVIPAQEPKIVAAREHCIPRVVEARRFLSFEHRLSSVERFDPKKGPGVYISAYIHEVLGIKEEIEEIEVKTEEIDVKTEEIEVEAEEPGVEVEIDVEAEELEMLEGEEIFEEIEVEDTRPYSQLAKK